jgi:hypothetical protein
MAINEPKNGSSYRGRRLPKHLSIKEMPKRLPSDDLLRFQRGEIGEQEYLEARLDVAIAHLRNRLSTKRLVMVREVVRDMLDKDPVLIAMKDWVLRGKRPRG